METTAAKQMGAMALLELTALAAMQAAGAMCFAFMTISSVQMRPGPVARLEPGVQEGPVARQA